MWQHFAVFNAILALSTASAITDMSDICKNMRAGDVVAHPKDCAAYFICGTVPALRYCNDGLHFDSLRKVCNWPEHAHCQLSNDDALVDPLPEQTDKPKGNVASSVRLHPVFVAIDVETGKATNPMDKYDAKHVECRHFGAYFLPHPGSCRRYYICAYGHLHRHKCGRGTAWSYKTQECELQNEAECYSRTVAGMDIDAVTDDFENDDDIVDGSFTTTAYPSTQQASTVCFVIDTTIVTGTTGSTFNPTGTYHTATTDGTWHPTGTGVTMTPYTPTGETTWYPTGTYHTATTDPSRAPTRTTPRADSGASPATGGFKCPPKGEAYLPNVLDCSKYFICIAGTPVATTCPQGLYWDQSAEFCDLAKNVHCFKQ